MLKINTQKQVILDGRREREREREREWGTERKKASLLEKFRSLRYTKKKMQWALSAYFVAAIFIEVIQVFSVE